jgi:hypothetical protein
MKRLWTCLVILAILDLIAGDHSLASQPKPRTIIGCATNFDSQFNGSHCIGHGIR